MIISFEKIINLLNINGRCYYKLMKMTMYVMTNIHHNFSEDEFDESLNFKFLNIYVLIKI
jgi:hypothetical protein